jgi:hypothetical protein
MNIWRLNVRESQIQSCIGHKKFAIGGKPRNPEVEKEDYLLLQLVAADASRLSKSDARVEYALIFDHYEYDSAGSISRYFWPDADKTWPWIMHCSDIVPTVPFSLERLQLNHSYAGRTNPIRIQDDDFKKIIPYILRYGRIEEIGNRVRSALETEPVKRNYKIWAILRNNDRIVEDSPDQINWRIVPARKDIQRNPELPVVLKELYEYKCQICGDAFWRRYEFPYQETHHVIWLSRGGVDHSNNLIVICPNHHRIIHETNPKFDRKKLAYIYPNGFQERLQLKKHLKDSALVKKTEQWAVQRRIILKKERGNTRQ